MITQARIDALRALHATLLMETPNLPEEPTTLGELAESTAEALDTFMAEALDAMPDLLEAAELGLEILMDDEDDGDEASLAVPKSEAAASKPIKAVSRTTRPEVDLAEEHAYEMAARDSFQEEYDALYFSDGTERETGVSPPDPRPPPVGVKSAPTGPPESWLIGEETTTLPGNPELNKKRETTRIVVTTVTEQETSFVTRLYGTRFAVVRIHEGGKTGLAIRVGERDNADLEDTVDDDEALVLADMLTEGKLATLLAALDAVNEKGMTETRWADILKARQALR